MLLRRRETPSPRPSSSSSGPGFVPFQLSDEQYASVYVVQPSGAAIRSGAATLWWIQ